MKNKFLCLISCLICISSFAHANYFIFLMNNTPESITVNNICDANVRSTGCETLDFPVDFPAFQRYKTFVINYNDGIKIGKDYTLQSQFNLPNHNMNINMVVTLHGDTIGSHITAIDAYIDGQKHTLLDSNNSIGKVLPDIVGSYKVKTNDGTTYTLYASAQHDYLSTQGIHSIYLTLDKDYETFDSIPDSNTISLMSYNIQAFPFYIGVALDLNKMDTRMNYLTSIAKIRNYDVVSFQEAWDKDARFKIKSILSNYYPYSIDPIPENIHQGSVLNSGLLVLSKYPIVTSKFINYQDYQTMTDSDKLTNKGALYFKINKNGKNYNFITTHTQAQDYDSAITIRQEEFRLIRDKLINDELVAISRKEPLLVFGDLNTDLYNNSQFSYMKDTLNLNSTFIKNTLYKNPVFSYDSKINLMIDPNAPEHGMYDYIVPVNDFQLPIKADYELTPIRAVDYAPMYTKSNNGKLYNRGDVELSDHFMLQGRFYFPEN